MKDEILSLIADNPALTYAVKAVMIKYFSTDKLTSDLADIELGQMVRARLVGLRALDEAFKEIAQHKTLSKVEQKTNPAY